MTAPRLTIVVPCHNEQEALPETLRRIETLLRDLMSRQVINVASRAWLVDDGSLDATWNIIREASFNPAALFCGIKLSRNQGHQAALLAGLLTVPGDVIITIDADLQDDLGAIPAMLREYSTGCEIVYGVRVSRDTDTFLKRFTAEAYYRLMERLGVELVFNHADYRLMSRRAVEALRAYPEANIFLRGLVPQLGFRSARVDYVRAERVAGKSKYPLHKMLSLAWQGITSFSTAPLKVITGLGISVSLISLGLGAWAFWARLIADKAIPGWASIVIPLFLLSGVQLLSLGVIGEYLAKVFLETKRRPHFFIEDTCIANDPASASPGRNDESSVRQG